jgi:hypothetical protein
MKQPVDDEYCWCFCHQCFPVPLFCPWHCCSPASPCQQIAWLSLSSVEVLLGKDFFCHRHRQEAPRQEQQCRLGKHSHSVLTVSVVNLRSVIFKLPNLSLNDVSLFPDSPSATIWLSECRGEKKDGFAPLS